MKTITTINTVRSLAALAALAVTAAPAGAAGFYSVAPDRDIRQCVQAIGERADYSGAARVEHDDIRIGKAARPVEIGFQDVVDAADLIAHDFRRRVPYAQLFAKLRIEGFKERLIEIGNGGHGGVFIIDRRETHP